MEAAKITRKTVGIRWGNIPQICRKKGAPQHSIVTLAHQARGDPSVCNHNPDGGVPSFRRFLPTRAPSRVVMLEINILQLSAAPKTTVF